MEPNETGNPPNCAPRSFAFGSFVLVPERQLLLNGEKPVRIGLRALDILTALIERPGDVVSKRELFARVWPDTFVEESNLKVNMTALRRALGEEPGKVRYIATVYGKGYRFVAPVHRLDRPPPLIDARAASMHRHNLPNETTHIVGREETVDAILRELDETRLVSVVGAGGIGKTTVALAVAERSLGAYRDGVWLVDLAPLNDPRITPNAIARAIGVAAQGIATLSEYLRDREMLIVLDSCEHIVDAVASCTDRILADAARVKILATSREPLRLKGERVRRLPGLATPPISSCLNAEEALAFPAIQLFVDRATDRLETFSLSDTDAPTVAEICRRLDGLALAIELAATRIDAFGVSGILDQIDARFRMMKGHRGGPERHRTLTATIDWSYDVLSENERSVLRRLSVFAGAFSLDSACAVATDNNMDRAGAIDALANLVAKSLVSVEVGEVATHYRLLDTTRHYALQKLEDNNELDLFRRRHIEQLLLLAERAETEWETRPTSDWLAHYGRRVDDIRSALNWALTESRDVASGVALTVAAIPFWEHLSLVDECRACIERALERTADLRDRDEMKLRTALGTTLLQTRGPLPQVKLAWARALEIAERLGDANYQLRCLWGLCDYHTWTGDHRSALGTAEVIRKIASEAGDLAALVNVDRQAGTALRYMGQLAEARGHLERMIDRYVVTVTRAEIARFQLDPRVAARGTLANVLWLQGYPDQAVRLATEQLEGAQAADHALALCSALVHTACPIALFVGDMAYAEKLLATVQSHAAKHSMIVWKAMANCLRGEWLLKHGDVYGLTVLRQALDELSHSGFRMRYPAYLGTFAEGLIVHGETRAARVAIDEAIALSESIGECWCMPELIRIKGDVLLSSRSAGSMEAAEGQYLRALELAREQGALSWELRSAISLTELSRHTGKRRQAKDLLSSVYERFDEGFTTRDVQRAKSLLDEMKGLSGERHIEGRKVQGPRAVSPTGSSS